MPHYKDGTEAKVGDLVIGVPYNQNGKMIAGTVLQVISDSESCNVRVAFAKFEKITIDEAVHGRNPGALVYSYGDGENYYRVTPDFDYGETRVFELIHRQDDAISGRRMTCVMD